MIDSDLLNFFRKLEQNNNKDWFNQRKDDYKTMKAAFEQTIKGVAVDIAQFDEHIHRDLGSEQVVKVPRIYRDMRFRPDDAVPLKTSIMATISPLGDGKPAYYISINAGGGVAGGGLHQPDRNTLNTIRERIDEKPEELERVVDSDDFRKIFPEGLDDADSLKTAPRGYSTDHPAIRFLRLNQYLSLRHFSKGEVTHKDFQEALLETFKMQYRLLNYLRSALA